jgi:hypothetical protein
MLSIFELRPRAMNRTLTISQPFWVASDSKATSKPNATCVSHRRSFHMMTRAMLTRRLVHSIADPRQRHCSDCEPIARKARAQSEDYDGSGLPPSSAKIRMMLKLLESIKTRSGGKEKTIIFSQVRFPVPHQLESLRLMAVQFTSFLNLIEPFLRREGIKYVRCEFEYSTQPRELHN